jgi:DNA polymerase-3 subunit gamma/tau
MQGVAESTSEKILLLVDELISEGHSPAHFARQLVRFLRNVTVAKIAGKDSALLQIADDERARAARIAELFSEEDLARHLQIMLRTHAELGYRQDQRFHLELGLLKMSHAQRLLPLEQLLSDVSPSSSTTPRAAGRPVLTAPSEARRTEPQTPARSNYVSPFAADSARKNTPKAETGDMDVNATRPGSTGGTVVIMGSAAPAISQMGPAPHVTSDVKISAESLRDIVLNALNAQPMLVSMLEAAQWIFEGNSLVARVSLSSTMIDMSFTADARRVASAAASGAAGRPVKMQVLPGGTMQAASPVRRTSSNGNARNRAEQDPVVRSMQEKFGAEIRTVIDYREKT